jgi:hypothetical protein
LTDPHGLRPARVFTMRGKYRHTFLHVSADGEETTQSANLEVEANKTLPIVVERSKAFVFPALVLHHGHAWPCTLAYTLLSPKKLLYPVLFIRFRLSDPTLTPEGRLEPFATGRC